MAIQNLCRPGDNIVSSTDLYGGTWNLFANTLPSMGITVRFADPADPQAFRRASDERTRAYYAETLPNPKLTVFPIGEVAAIGRDLGRADLTWTRSEPSLEDVFIEIMGRAQDNFG